jgi:hypothetical protein
MPEENWRSTRSRHELALELVLLCTLDATTKMVGATARAVSLHKNVISLSPHDVTN